MWHGLGRYKFSSVMLAHHGAVLTLAILVALAPFSHWGAPFLAGLIEFTNLPLTVMDLFKSFKDLQQRFPGTFLASQAIFAIGFFVLRVVLWLPIFGLIFSDSITFLRIGGAQGLQFAAAAYMIPTGGFLTGLQLLWAWKIVKMIMRTVRGA